MKPLLTIITCLCSLNLFGQYLWSPSGTIGNNTSNNHVGIGNGISIPVSTLEIVDVNPTLFLRNTNSGGYTSLRLYNDFGYSGAHFLEVDYAGSTMAGSLLVNGPQNESASISTPGSYPLAFGTNNTARMTITAAGLIGIGTHSPDKALTVNGSVHAKEIIVDLSIPTPDYVFEESYKLPSIEQVKAYIKQNKHLPEIPSAKDIKANGINVGEMNTLLLKKIEELTLYVIEMKEAADKDRATIAELKIELTNQKKSIK